MKYCFDIDGTICTTSGTQYAAAVPILGRIAQINKLILEGHEVIYFTARGSSTGIDYTKLTQRQLQSWGAIYTKLIMGKPGADFFIDDRAISDSDYFNDELGPQHV